MGSGIDDAQGITMPLAVAHQDVQGATSVITLRGKLMLGEECQQLETLVPQLLKNGRKNLVFELDAGCTVLYGISQGQDFSAVGSTRSVRIEPAWFDSPPRHALSLSD